MGPGEDLAHIARVIARDKVTACSFRYGNREIAFDYGEVGARITDFEYFLDFRGQFMERKSQS
jgi:hypothetical protein